MRGISFRLAVSCKLEQRTAVSHPFSLCLFSCPWLSGKTGRGWDKSWDRLENNPGFGQKQCPLGHHRASGRGTTSLSLDRAGPRSEGLICSDGSHPRSDSGPPGTSHRDKLVCSCGPSDTGPRSSVPLGHPLSLFLQPQWALPSPSKGQFPFCFQTWTQTVSSARNALPPVLGLLKLAGKVCFPGETALGDVRRHEQKAECEPCAPSHAQVTFGSLQLSERRCTGKWYDI